MWLGASFRKGTRLSGILYLHRIIDPRMHGSALSNMRMFRRLCGPDFYENVVLATTFWGSINPALGAQREKELCDNKDFWGQLVESGSQVVRLAEDEESSRRLLLSLARKDRSVLEAQKQMQAGKSVGDIAAFHRVAAECERKFNQEIEREYNRRSAELLRRDNEIREKIRQQNRATEKKRSEAARKVQDEEERRDMRRRARIEQQRREMERQERELEELRWARRQEKPYTLQEDPECREPPQGNVDNHHCKLRNVEKRRCDQCGYRLHSRYTNYTEYHRK
jgi:hypothetical protein